MQKILFLAANPKNTTRLRLDEELRDIEEGLVRAKLRDQFTLAQRQAVRPRDLRRAMLDEKPQIVHFSGHGEGVEGLVFEDDMGNAQTVSGEALAALFELFTDCEEFPYPVYCVVLNGCYSQVQAEAIAKYVPYVVGMTKEIGDKAAIEFAVGFYDALGAGRSVESAFKQGSVAIQLAGKSDGATPVLINNKPLTPPDSDVTPPGQSPPSFPSPSSIPLDRFELYQFLLKLPGSQFEQVLFDLNPPPGNISPSHASQGQRVPELFTWLESIGPGLDALRVSLEKVTTLATPDRPPNRAETLRDSSSDSSGAKALLEYSISASNEVKLLGSLPKQILGASSEKNNCANSFTQDIGQEETIEMMLIPEGKFYMGSPTDEHGHQYYEKPQHWVNIKPFLMSKYLITQMQWNIITSLPRVEKPLESNPFKFKGSNLPADSISWEEAAEFCQRLSRKTGRIFRLPSESQWEYACRARTTTPFYYGDSISTSIVNFNGKPYGLGSREKFRNTTVEVGSIGSANAFGLFDMHGNLNEWCSDLWHNSYELSSYTAPVDGSSWDIGHGIRERVTRGGAWNDAPEFCRSACRRAFQPDFKSSTIGFRIVSLI